MVGLVHGIILAAGLSTRMGDAKLLLELQGRSLVARVVGAALQSRLHQVTLVVGSHNREIRDALTSEMANPKLTLAVNPDPAEGMSSSLRIGVASLGSGASGAMILLADQPLVSSEILDRLITEFHQDIEKIVLPTIHGRRTTPVIFPADMFPDLMKVTGDKGGRDVVNKYASRVVAMEVGSLYDDADVDTREDLDALRAKLIGSAGDLPC